MPYASEITENIGIGASVWPVSLNSSNKSAGPIDMSKFKRAMFVLTIGTVSTGKITAALQAGANSNLTGATNVSNTNASLVNLNTTNQTYSFEMRADQMPSNTRYLSLYVAETNGNATIVSVACWGDQALQNPGSAQNASSVINTNVVV